MSTIVERALEAHAEEQAKYEAEEARRDASTREWLKGQLREILGEDTEFRDGSGPQVYVDDTVTLVFSQRVYDDPYSPRRVEVSMPGLLNTHKVVYEIADIGAFLEENIECLPPPEPQFLAIDVDEDGEAMCPQCGRVGLRCTVRDNDYDSPFTVNEHGDIEYVTCNSDCSYVIDIYCSHCGFTIKPGNVEIKWKELT